MPAAIPLIAAGFSISSGLAVGGLIGGLMIAGGGLTAVGALTGNKDLMTLGSVLGIAGGVGSLAGLGGEAATLAGSAPLSEMDSVYQGASGAGASTTANVGGSITQGGADVTSAALSTANEAGSSLAGAGSNAPTGLLQEAMNSGPPADALSQAMEGSRASNSLGSNLDNAATSAASPTRALNSAMPQGNDVAQNALGQAGPGSMAEQYNPSGAGQAGGAASDGARMTATQYDLQNGTYGSPPSDGGGTTQAMQGGFGAGKPGDAATSWWDTAKGMAKDFVKFTKENPELTNNAAGLIKGAFGYYGEQQKAEDDQQRKMAYDDWKRQRYSDSVRNLRVPGVVRTSSPTGGIIAGARG